MRTLLALAAIVVLRAAAAAAVDGRDIPADFCSGGVGGCTALLAVQDTHTGFGDTYPPTGSFRPGSELDQMFVYKTSDSLAISITGNLEPNQNHLIIFLDVAAGGVSVVNVTAGPWGVRNLNNSKFDAGFEPEYAVAMNVYQGTLYVDLVNLTANSNRYLGAIPFGGAGPLTGGNTAGTVVGFNNTNSAGVTDDSSRPAAQQQADAATALQGLEMLLRFADIGADSTLASVRVMALVSSPGGYASNQVLPGIGGAGQKGNLGQAPIDFSDEAKAPGLQFANVQLITKAPPTVDGDNIPVESGSATLAATQNNYTGFGDNNSSGQSGASGSEMDALFMADDPVALRVGITGNLESNGNYWVLFLETCSGGVSPTTGIDITPQSGPISGIFDEMRYTTFDEGFRPSHALLLNGGFDQGQRVVYVDLYDFRTNSNQYLGRCVVNSGSGELTGGANPLGVQVAFDDSNSQGVTADAAKSASQNAADALTAQTGAEIVLPYTAIGLAQRTIRYLALVTGNRGYLSNQFLPALGGGVGNLGDPPRAFSQVPGQQHGSYTLVSLPELAFQPSIAGAAALADGSGVQVPGTVTAVFPEQDQFYIQQYKLTDPVALKGIMVSGESQGRSVGESVVVGGLLTRISGERAIAALNVGAGQTPEAVAPVGMTNGAVGGAQAGPNPGIAGASGAQNIGLLVKVSGKITQGLTIDDDGTSYFYLDDGSGVRDGNIFGARGIRVDLPASVSTLPPDGSFVTVTGVSSVRVIEGLNQRRIRARGPADIVQQ